MSDASDAWFVAHTINRQLILVSPGQELYLGPFANICDLERAMTRLCRLASDATVTASRDTAGRAKLRFSDGSRFTVTSEAEALEIAVILRRARYAALDDQPAALHSGKSNSSLRALTPPSPSRHRRHPTDEASMWIDSQYHLRTGELHQLGEFRSLFCEAPPDEEQDSCALLRP